MRHAARMTAKQMERADNLQLLGSLVSVLIFIGVILGIYWTIFAK